MDSIPINSMFQRVLTIFIEPDALYYSAVFCFIVVAQFILFFPIGYRNHINFQLPLSKLFGRIMNCLELSGTSMDGLQCFNFYREGLQIELGQVLAPSSFARIEKYVLLTH